MRYMVAAFIMASLALAATAQAEYCVDNFGAGTYLLITTKNELTNANITRMSNLSATNLTNTISFYNASTVSDSAAYPSCFKLPSLAGNVSGDSWVTIGTSSGYAARTLNFPINGSASDYRKFYLIPFGSGFYFSLYVSSVTGEQLDGATVAVSKIIGTSFTNVSDIYTDDSGLALNYLQEASYRFTIRKPGYNTLTVALTPNPDNPVSYVRLNVVGAAYTSEDYASNVTAPCSYSSATGYVTCAVTDSLGVPSICLKVYKSGVLNHTLFNTTCSSGAAFNLIINTSLMTGINNTIRYVVVTGNGYIINDGYLERAAYIPFGLMGVFVTALLVTLLATLFASNPAVVIVMGVLGFIIAMSFSLISSPILAVGSLLVVALILIVKVKS